MNNTRIGYACLNMDIKNSSFKTCRINNVTDEKLIELINYNIDTLDKMINYNIENNIQVFRITSSLIPFGSSEVNKIDWQKLFKGKLEKIALKISKNDIRISVHPGQYTVLNSPNHKVVENSIRDLVYHTKILKSLGATSENKMVIHIGGAYGDKKSSIERFISRYNTLNNEIKEHLVIENDDKIFNIEEVLTIGESIGCPVVFDNLHNKINPTLTKSKKEILEEEWIYLVSKTWNNIKKRNDGRQKIHYSEQDINKNPGSHSETIDVNKFIYFYNKLIDKNIDIMLEVKDKNRSAIKCIESIN